MDKALLVGINSYPTSPLNGCVNDAVDVAMFLNGQYNFDANYVRLLTDSRATKQNIIERLKWLFTGLSAGDRALFLFSGHGAQCPVRAADGTVTKIYDAICPVDFTWNTDGFNAISDADFSNLFSVIPAGVEFIWVSDSCFSGGLTKALSVAAQCTLVKSMPTPADIQWRLTTARKNNLQSLGFKSVAGALNVGLLAACKADEEASDAVFEDKPNGAFTYFLLKKLNADGRNKNLMQLTADVNTDLANNQYTQHSLALGSEQVCNRAFLTL